MSDVLTALTETTHRRYAFLKRASCRRRLYQQLFYPYRSCGSAERFGGAAKFWAKRAFPLPLYAARPGKEGRVPLVFITHQTTEKA
ncbi:MAG: hypothetical protein ACLT0Y_05020 [Christensenellales bacterium]